MRMYCENIVLLLPSENLEESLQILSSRSTGDYSPNRRFITSPCNEELATIVIYENGRTPKQVAQDIMNSIQMKKNESNRIKKNVGKGATVIKVVAK